MSTEYYRPETQLEIVEYILSEKRVTFKTEVDNDYQYTLLFLNDDAGLLNLTEFIETQNASYSGIGEDIRVCHRSIALDHVAIPYLRKDDDVWQGMARTKDLEYEFTYQKIISDYEFLEFDYDIEDNTLCVERYCQSRMVADKSGEMDCFCLFKGTIKNVSEFKRLVKQLGIE